mgnify:CR=1 FL=1
MKLFLILFCLVFGACSSLPFKGSDYSKGAKSIAQSQDLVGKFEMYQCYPFAKDLHTRLKEAGVVSRLVVYYWRSGLKVRGHAIVLYVDNGKIYGMDNLTYTPRIFKNGKVLDLARQFDEGASTVFFATVIKD